MHIRIYIHIGGTTLGRDISSLGPLTSAPYNGNFMSSEMLVDGFKYVYMLYIYVYMLYIYLYMLYIYLYMLYIYVYMIVDGFKYVYMLYIYVYIKMSYIYIYIYIKLIFIIITHTILYYIICIHTFVYAVYTTIYTYMYINNDYMVQFSPRPEVGSTMWASCAGNRKGFLHDGSVIVNTVEMPFEEHGVMQQWIFDNSVKRDIQFFMDGPYYRQCDVQIPSGGRLHVLYMYYIYIIYI
jgi:hypothetical protein